MPPRGIHHAFANLLYRPQPCRGFGIAIYSGRAGTSARVRERRESQGDGKDQRVGGAVTQAHKRRGAWLKTGRPAPHSKRVRPLDIFLGVGRSKRNNLLSQSGKVKGRGRENRRGGEPRSLFASKKTNSRVDTRAQAGIENI